MNDSTVAFAAPAGRAGRPAAVRAGAASIFRRRTNVPLWVYPARVLALASFLVLWELASGRVVDDFFVSRPSEVGPTLWRWITNGTVWYHAQSTLQSAVVGFAVGAGIAMTLGYILGQSPRLAAVFEPFITAVYAMPRLALIPLFIMWFGIGRDLQVAISALVSFFMMFYNTFFGIRDVDQGLIDQVRVLGGRRRHVALSVRMPSALVWVVAGLKISIPQAIVGVVVAEMLAGRRGLGYLVSHHANQFNASGTFAAISILLVLGFSVDRVVGFLTRKPLAWKNARHSDR